MNLFEDLIPGRQNPAQGGGLFDDLIPQAVQPQPGQPGPFTPERLQNLQADGVPQERLDQQQAIDMQAEAQMQPRAFEGVMGPGTAAAQYDNPFGSAGAQDPDAYDLIDAITGRSEREMIGEVAPGINARSGAPLGQRVNFGFMQTPEAERRFFENRFGAENEGWYFLSDPFGNQTSRVVVRNEDGSESLFNPPGVDFGDVAGLTGILPDLVGGVAGAGAALPSFALGPTAGIAGVSAGGALGAATASGLVGRAFPENREAEDLPDVLRRKSVDAGLDFALGNVMGQGARAVSGVTGRVAAPFKESAERGLAPAFRESAGRLRGQGYDVMPLPSEEGAGGFIPRLEGFLEKLPGSSAAMQNRRAEGEAAIDRFQRDLIGDAQPEQIGRGVVSELEQGRDALVRQRDDILQDVDTTVQSGFESAASRQGPETTAEAAGQSLRGGLERARGEFRTQADQLYTAARQAPGGTDPIVPTQGLRERVERIRSELPPEATRQLQVDTGLVDAQGRPIRRTETTGGGPSPEFTPDGLRRFFSGVDDIAEDITIDQARQMRRLLSDAIDDKTVLPGVPDRFLTQMRDELTGAIEGAAERAAPELRDALASANTFYRENRPRFDRAGVRETFRDPTQPGFREDNQLVTKLISGRGNPGAIRETRDLMGADSAEWASVRRNAWDEVTSSGQNQTLYGREVVDADGLVARLNKMDDEAVTELFGVDAQQLRALAADVSNRTRYLDADALSDRGSASVLASLRQAADLDEQLTREYRDNVIAPFLRGEDGSRAKMNAAELVPWLYRKATPDEVTQVMARLPDSLKADVEKGVVSDIVSRGVARGEDTNAILRVLSGDTAPANSDELASLLGTQGSDQAARVNQILTPETRQAVTDLAVITARRSERDAVTAAAGGIAAGTAVTRIMSDPVTGAYKAAILAGIAEIVTSNWFRRWTTNTARPGLSESALAGVSGVGPQMASGLGELVSEYGSKDAQAALDFLYQGQSQIGEGGERLTRPPAGSDSWEEYFQRLSEE